MIKFQVEVWIDEHYKTKDLDYIDLLGVTAVYQGRIPTSTLVELVDDLQAFLEEFRGLPTRECYTVDIDLSFGKGDDHAYHSSYTLSNITKAVD